LKELENIVSKYTGNGKSIAIQDMVKKLNGSGLKQTYKFFLNYIILLKKITSEIELPPA